MASLLFNARYTAPPFISSSPISSNSPQWKPLFFSVLSCSKKTPKAGTNGENGAPETPKRTQRARKKPQSSTPVKKKRKSVKNDLALDESKVADAKIEAIAKETEEEEEVFDDEIDFPYESPPLVCCFGAAHREFVPTVRVSERRMHPDKYSSWKGLQWSPPEFVRAPGGSPSNVAISHVRLGGRAVFMGKVGDDDFGNDLVYKMNTEKVQTRAVKIDPGVRTAASYMRIGFRDDGDRRRMVAETVKACAEDSFLSSEVDVAVLKEVYYNHGCCIQGSSHPQLLSPFSNR